jgi:acetyl-CoA acetyltransferase
MSRAAKGREAVIVSTARTPLAKSWKGALNMTHGATMGAHVIKAAVERAGIDPVSIDDVIIGCGNPEGATGLSIARRFAGQRARTDRRTFLFIRFAGHRTRGSARHRR